MTITCSEAPPTLTTPHTNQVALCQSIDELKVLQAIDISVLHELEILLIHTPLNVSWHRVREDVPALTFLHQSLQVKGHHDHGQYGKGSAQS